MIFGGKWSKQDKVVPGVFINFISPPRDGATPIYPNDPSLPDMPAASRTAMLGVAMIGRLVIGGDYEVRELCE